MFCPQCRTEYREGFYTCADCSVPLVNELPPIDEAYKDAVETNNQYKDDLIDVFETSSQSDILIVKSLLDGEQIPYHFSGDFFHMSGFLISPARLFVSSDSRARVLEILKELQIIA